MQIFLKYLAKISAAVEAGHECNICDRLVCFPQQAFCLFDAVVNQIIHRRLVKSILEGADNDDEQL